MLFFNRVRVLPAIANHGRSHCTVSFCVYGIAESKFVITVTPQNYVCPHGGTYVMKVVAMVRNRITTLSDSV
jgi:hypothetical protein